MTDAHSAGRPAWAAHREHHGIAQDLDQILVQEAHVPRPKEAKRLGAVLLDSYELLHA